VKMADGWEIECDLRGLPPVDVLNAELAPGPHKAQILGCREVRADDVNKKGSLRFSVLDIEETSLSQGMQAQVVIGTDYSKDFNCQHTVNLLHGIGANPEKVKSIKRLSSKMFEGKSCYIYVKAAVGEVDELGRKPLQQINFVTAEMYLAAKRAAKVAIQPPSEATPKADLMAATGSTNSRGSRKTAEVPAEDIDGLFRP